jgi:hypothetical protein
MRHFHLKSILLGIGIGIIITSILNMIYMAGLTPHLTSEEIREKAKEYGMVEKTVLLQEEKTSTQEQVNKEISTQNSTSSTEPANEADKTVSEEKP